jgi:hypothetical protein
MAPTQQAQIQLSLLARPAWRLDERTRAIGMRGVANAREALRQAHSGQTAPIDHSQRQAA